MRRELVVISLSAIMMDVPTDISYAELTNPVPIEFGRQFVSFITGD